MNGPILDKTTISHPQDQLIEMITRWVAPLGYRIIHLEIQTHREKVLRLYIDFATHSPDKTIGIEDCVKVTKALDEPLDQSAEVSALLPDAYELEVSSPGINRPLRTQNDFETFVDQQVRIHTYRPLSGEELTNENYFQRNPKQKNFMGILKGIQEDKVLLSISTHDKGDRSSTKKKKKVSKKALMEAQAEEDVIITLPLPLISKANLEPTIDIENKHDKE
jgi:ribosome maturation factor RimP